MSREFLDFTSIGLQFRKINHVGCITLLDQFTIGVEATISAVVTLNAILGIVNPVDLLGIIGMSF